MLTSSVNSRVLSSLRSSKVRLSGSTRVFRTISRTWRYGSSRWSKTVSSVWPLSAWAVGRAWPLALCFPYPWGGGLHKRILNKTERKYSWQLQSAFLLLLVTWDDIWNYLPLLPIFYFFHPQQMFQQILVVICRGDSYRHSSRFQDIYHPALAGLL